MYKIVLHKKVIKFLEKHPDVRERFNQKLGLLRRSKWESLDIQPLTGTEEDEYRLRIGRYRFRFIRYEDELFLYFYKADSRGQVYK